MNQSFSYFLMKTTTGFFSDVDIFWWYEKSILCIGHLFCGIINLFENVAKVLIFLKLVLFAVNIFLQRNRER